MAHHLRDFPPGPLKKYRSSASFEWKRLKLFLETEEYLEFQHRLLAEIQRYPEFLQKSLQSPTLDEVRRITTARTFALQRVKDAVTQGRPLSAAQRQAFIGVSYAIDPSASVKRSVTFDLFANTIKMQGTERHLRYLQNNPDILGCFCLTEIAHGSNTRGMKTTATYDAASKQFVLNTPNFEAAKCWVGSLGQTASHAVVFAHLTTPDGARRGLHTFLVKIRDPKTLLPLPGIKICDLGEKMGLNGVDNGFIMFDHHRIPRESLFNKASDVTEDGRYVTSYKDANKRHGAALGNLSDGRLNISSVGTTYLSNALTIALRYAAVRKQFGPEDGDEEAPILEYQTHQHRLLPHLAEVYAFKIFCSYVLEVQARFVSGLEKKGDVADMGLEIHAISSACKPVITWAVRDGIQQCREACAGHGYLKAAGLGDLRNAHEPTMTYEGENHVLIQQTSNWLLKLWPLVLKGAKIATPLNSVSFLNDAHQILTWKFSANSVEQMIEPKSIFSTFQWLTCYLLKSSFEKRNGLANSFWAKNNSQVYFAKDLAVVYIQHLILQKMSQKISEATDAGIKDVLLRLFSLFGVWCLEKHIPILYLGGYAVGPNAAALIQDSILMLCSSLKDEAVALVDVIAPPDTIMNSVLGYSDGEVYKHLEAAMLSAPGAMTRPKWWKEIAYWKDKIKSKL